jgi:hypothetical protein
MVPGILELDMSAMPQRTRQIDYRDSPALARVA